METCQTTDGEYLRSVEVRSIQGGLWDARPDSPGGGLSDGEHIAEGFGRKGSREFARYLTMAQASSVEIQSHLYVALDLGYVEQPTFDALFQQARRVEDLIGGLIRYLDSVRTTNEQRRTTND